MLTAIYNYRNYFLDVLKKRALNQTVIITGGSCVVKKNTVCTFCFTIIGVEEYRLERYSFISSIVLYYYRVGSQNLTRIEMCDHSTMSVHFTIIQFNDHDRSICCKLDLIRPKKKNGTSTMLLIYLPHLFSASPKRTSIGRQIMFKNKPHNCSFYNCPLICN